MTKEFEQREPNDLPLSDTFEGWQHSTTDQDADVIRRRSTWKGAIGGGLIIAGFSGAINEPLDWLTQHDPVNPANFVVDLALGAAFVLTGIKEIRSGLGE